MGWTRRARFPSDWRKLESRWMQVTAQLEQEGIQAFQRSFQSMLAVVEARLSKKPLIPLYSRSISCEIHPGRV